jgi:hypothetical protein
VITVVRAMSANASVEISVPFGPRTSWSIAAAIRRSDCRVLWIRVALVSPARWNSPTSGSASAASTRGSPPALTGSCSLATSSLCRTSSAGASSTSTS